MLFSNSVEAQTADFDLSVSPPITHLIIQPGKAATLSVQVQNNGSYDLNITPKFLDFQSDNKTGAPVILDTMSFAYIFLEDRDLSMQTGFLLKSGESKQLTFLVQIPENKPEKEYYFSLLLEAEPLDTSLRQNSQTSIQAVLGSNMIVTITNTAEDKGEIQLYSFEAPIFLDSILSSISSQILVKNTGQTMTVTTGKIEIFDMFNKKVYEKEIMPENVLPGATRELKIAADVQQNDAVLKTPEPFLFKPPFLLGSYTMRITYASATQEKKVYEHKMYAIPVSLLLLMLIMCICYFLYTKTNFFVLDRKRVSKQTE